MRAACRAGSISPRSCERLLFREATCTVLTSATLSVGGERSLLLSESRWRARLPRQSRSAVPFDYGQANDHSPCEKNARAKRSRL